MAASQVAIGCGNCRTTEDVSWYCKNCGGDLCTKCKETHATEKPMFRDHRIISKAEAVKIRRREYCSLHSYDTLIMHCDDCNKLVCATCISCDHRGHDLSKIAKVIEKTQENLKRFCDQLKSKVLVKCTSEKDKLKINRTENQKWINSVQSEIDARRQDLLNTVNVTCDELVSIAAAEKKQNDLVIDNSEEELQNKIIEVGQLISRLEDVSTLKDTQIIQLTQDMFEVDSFKLPQTKPLVFSTFIVGKTNSDQLTEQLGKFQISNTPLSTLVSESDKPSTEGNTEPLQEPLAGLKKEPEALDLPQYKSEFMPTSLEEPHSVTPDTVQEPNVPDKPVFSVQVQQRQKFDFSVDTIVPVCEDQAWVSEWKTKQIKLIDEDGKILKTMNTDFDVYHFDVLNTGEIIAADYWGKCVKRLSNTGEVTKTIHTPDYSPTGMCVCDKNENVAVVGTRSYAGSKLVVYRLTDGQEVSSTQYSDCWSAIQRVKQTKTGDFCILNANETVYLVHTKGEIKFTYRGQGDKKMKKFNPCDVCCDEYNNILISDRNNHTIHVLDHHGNLIRYLLSEEDGISYPRGLGTLTGGRLWIGDENGSLVIVKCLNIGMKQNTNCSVM